MKQKEFKKIMIGLTIASIEASAKSLWAQLNEYDFLTVTDEQAKELERIEQELHQVIKDITS